MKLFSTLLPSSSFQDVFFRFPISFLCSVLLFLLLVVDNHIDWIGAEGLHIIVTAVSCFFACGALQLFAESREFSRIQSFFLSLPGLLFPGLFLWLSPQWEQHALFLIPGMLLFLMVAPFIGQKNENGAFWHYNAQVWTFSIIGSLAAILLCGGISLALTVGEKLLGFSVPNKWGQDIWIFGVTVFAPLYVLCRVPCDLGATEMPRTYMMVLKFIVSWICVPLAAIYLLILYAYFFRILIEWELPEGQLGWITVGFGGAGIAAYLVCWPFRDEGSIFLRLFYRYFFWILIIPAVMMLSSIWIRLREYGVTEERYIVFMTGCWFLAVIGCFLSRVRLLKFIPLILGVFLLLASFGPWGAVSVSLHSQLGRLEKLLVKNEILQNGKIVKVEEEIPFEDEKSISSIVNFLEKRNRLGIIYDRYMEKGGRIEDSEALKSKHISKHTVELMGLEYIGHRQRDRGKNNTFYYKRHASMPTMNISGYDYIMDIKGDLRMTELSVNDLSTIYSIFREGTSIYIQGNGRTLIQADLVSYINKYIVGKEGLKKSDIPPFVMENENLKIQVIVDYLYGAAMAGQSVEVGKISYILFIGFK